MKRIVDSYINHYYSMLDQNIRENNEYLYKGLGDFLAAHNTINQDDQLPTCVVVTSSESASSIDM